jgi:hypothetical protein
VELVWARDSARYRDWSSSGFVWAPSRLLPFCCPEGNSGRASSPRARTRCPASLLAPSDQSPSGTPGERMREQEPKPALSAAYRENVAGLIPACDGRKVAAVPWGTPLNLGDGRMGVLPDAPRGCIRSPSSTDRRTSSRGIGTGATTSATTTQSCLIRCR